LGFEIAQRVRQGASSLFPGRIHGLTHTNMTQNTVYMNGVTAISEA
jgi:hypothetical protein